MEDGIEIPQAWDQLTIERLRGTLLVVGAPDVGKSTFAQYLYRRLCAEHDPVAYLDGDPGQHTLGPPATMTVAMGPPGEDGFPPRGRTWRSFVGAVSPRGHMLPLLVGASRLVRAACGAGARAIVYDTSGLVDPARGGLALKLAKVDLLRPTTVFAIQRGGELEALLVPLRRSRRVRVVDLKVATAAQRRAVPERQNHRAQQFAEYFAPAEAADAGHALRVDMSRLAVMPIARLSPNRLVAFEDEGGYILGLGIVLESDARTGQAIVCTPLASLAGVDALRVGDLWVDPRTFRDRRVDAE